MPRNFLQKTFTHWLDKNATRFNHPPCKIQYKYGGIQFNLQGIIPEILWRINYHDVMLYISYKDNSFWDAIGECNLYEKRSVNHLYYCELCAWYHEHLEAGCKTQLYPTRQALWKEHCFESVLQVSNERTQPDLWLCFWDYGGLTEAKVQPKEKIETINKSKHFVDAINVHSI